MRYVPDLRDNPFKPQVDRFKRNVARLLNEPRYFSLVDMVNEGRTTCALSGKVNKLSLEIEVPLSSKAFNPKVGNLRLRDTNVLTSSPGDDYLVTLSFEKDGELLNADFYPTGEKYDEHFVRRLYAMSGKGGNIVPARTLSEAIRLGVEVMDITGRGKGRDIIDRQLGRGRYDFRHVDSGAPLLIPA